MYDVCQKQQSLLYTLDGPWGKFPDHYEVRRQLLHIFSSSEEQQSVLDMLVYNMMAWGDRIKNLNGFSDDPKNILQKFSLQDDVTFLCSLCPVRSRQVLCDIFYQMTLKRVIENGWKFFRCCLCNAEWGQGAEDKCHQQRQLLTITQF